MTTTAALHALKCDTGMDYTHADYETQEEMAEIYLTAQLALSGWGKAPHVTTDEENAARRRNQIERYRRNGWTLPKGWEDEN